MGSLRPRQILDRVVLTLPGPEVIGVLGKSRTLGSPQRLEDLT
jgi:hypothetical protein